MQDIHNLENEFERKRTEQSFMVPKEEIEENDYDLSINRYKEIEYEEIEYEEPKEILENIIEIENKIQEELVILKKIIGD